MRKTASLMAAMMLCLVAQTIKAQQAKLYIDVKKPMRTEISLFARSTHELLPSRQLAVYSIKDNRVQLDLDLSQLTTFSIMGMSNNNWLYNINLSPGDSLHVLVDDIAGQDRIVVSGIGAENNQAFPDFLHRDHEAFKTDLYPDKLLKFLADEEQSLQSETAAYISKYKPSAAFQAVLQQNLAYAPALWFTDFFGNHKYFLQGVADSEALLQIWNGKKDSLLQTIEMNNEEALSSSFYTNLLHTYVLRRKEQLWPTAKDSTVLAFYYADYPADQRQAIFQSDPENLFIERIINKEFTGAVNEYLYADLLRNIEGSKKTNASAIFDRFAAKYPNSKYLPTFQSMIDEVRKNENRALTANMVFLDSTGTLTNFDEVLGLFKGKTVLVDMWGTWCAPCHQEIEKNSGPLKAHFKDKDLVFLYIANFDEGKQASWKKLISYYNLAGNHILASAALTEDISKKTKLSGYPTYLIIKKDGTYELSNAGYPMQREKLIQQITLDL
ncbi:TlpA disulfide reductase family protein [Sphingobacterium oryzagri]|uniref:TlpA disulfide reductase family protein n=1 Tax=Sphingobacterium oryzagri TaxID=3025669 RepID=A0ABY7WQM2_9SPHI|nr:TlpA disulfide reductase family protein [Sphingobacterium sp. KACC 22765]WDF70706.1 TlpA disulfide reductase family protein [Sphingobacterium sp. KACC 22765]